MQTQTLRVNLSKETASGGFTFYTQVTGKWNRAVYNPVAIATGYA